MVKLLTASSIILAIFLFPPAVLAVISNNALPGDAVYPIKRSLENGIYAIASINPISKAWFASARSDRRFKEFSTLIAQGRRGKETLNELVEQTTLAAEEIKKVDDPVKKQELIVKLSKSIEKYDQGLKQIAQQQTQETSLVTPAPVPAPKPSEAPRPTLTSTTSLHTPIPTPAPIQNQGPVDQASDVGDAIDRLEKIKDKLKEQNEKKEKIKNQENEHKNIDNQKREDKNLTPEKETDKIKKEKR